MQLAPPPALTSAPVARLEYVIRAPRGEAKPATIDAFVADPAAAEEVRGTFVDAVRAAQAAAATETLDGMHRIPVNQAQAVLQAGEGAWLIAPLVGDHREQVGPVFIDGTFYERAGLSLYGKRLAGGAALAAIVGVDNLLDLRNGRPNAGVSPIATLLAGSSH